MSDIRELLKKAAASNNTKLQNTATSNTPTKNKDEKKFSQRAVEYVGNTSKEDKMPNYNSRARQLLISAGADPEKYGKPQWLLDIEERNAKKNTAENSTAPTKNTIENIGANAISMIPGAEQGSRLVTKQRENDTALQTKSAASAADAIKKGTEYSEKAALKANMIGVRNNKEIENVISFYGGRKSEDGIIYFPTEVGYEAYKKIAGQHFDEEKAAVIDVINSENDVAKHQDSYKKFTSSSGYKAAQETTQRYLEYEKEYQSGNLNLSNVFENATQADQYLTGVQEEITTLEPIVNGYPFYIEEMKKQPIGYIFTMNEDDYQRERPKYLPEGIAWPPKTHIDYIAYLQADYQEKKERLAALKKQEEMFLPIKEKYNYLMGKAYRESKENTQEVADGKKKHDEAMKNIDEYVENNLPTAAYAGTPVVDPATGNVSISYGTVDPYILAATKEAARKENPIGVDISILSEEDKNVFYYLIGSGQEEFALQYAAEASNKAHAELLQNAKDWAGSNAGTRILTTLATILLAPAAAVEAKPLVEMTMGLFGFEIDPNRIDPMTGLPSHDTSLATILSTGTAGVAEHWNSLSGTIPDWVPLIGGEKISSTLPEWIPVVGGKGLGDLYSLGVSALQSYAYGLAFGAGGAAYVLGANAMITAYDDALSRGADNQTAALYGVLNGVAETLFEYVSIDKLVNNTAVRGALKTFFMQAGIEASEEALTSIANAITDSAVMGDLSNYNLSVQTYMKEGMSESQAKIKARKDIIEGILFDAFGGGLTGGFLGSLGRANSVREAKKTADSFSTILVANRGSGIYNKYAQEANVQDSDSDNEAKSKLAKWALDRYYANLKTQNEHMAAVSPLIEQQKETQSRAEQIQTANPEAEVITSASTQAYLDSGIDLKTAQSAGAVLDGIISGEITADNISSSQIDKLNLLQPNMRGVVSNALGVEIAGIVSKSAARNAFKQTLAKYEQRTATETTSGQVVQNEQTSPVTFDTQNEVTPQTISEPSATNEQGITKFKVAPGTIKYPRAVSHNSVATPVVESSMVNQVEPSITETSTVQEAPTRAMQMPEFLNEIDSFSKTRPEDALTISMFDAFNAAKINDSNVMSPAEFAENYRQANPKAKGKAILGAYNTYLNSMDGTDTNTSKSDGKMSFAEFRKQYLKDNKKASPDEVEYAYDRYLNGTTDLDYLAFEEQYRKEHPKATMGEIALAYQNAIEGNADVKSDKKIDDNDFGVIRNEYSAQIGKDIVDALDALGKLFNVRIQFADLKAMNKGDNNGLYNLSTKKDILLDINPQKAFMTVAGHEIGHHLREHISETAWNNFERYAVKVKGKDAISEKQNISAYAEESVAREEVACDFIGEMIGDKGLLNDFCEAIKKQKVNKEAARGFINAWKWFKGKFTGTTKKGDTETPALVEKVKAAFGTDIETATEVVKALQTAYNEVTKSDALLKKKNTADDGGVKHDLKYVQFEANTEILSLIDRVKNNRVKDSDFVDLGTVNSIVAKEIEKITGVDVHGWKVKIEARQIRHILKDHGANGATDHSMADDRNIARIEYVLKKPDDMSNGGKTKAYSSFKNGYNRTANTILYERRIGKNSMYVVEAVPESKAKTLYVVTAFIGKHGYKKGTQQLIDAKSPNATPKVGSAEVPIIIIDDTGKSVNPSDVKNSNEDVYKQDVKVKTDANGNTLSDDQESFFENSAVRDADGKLKVVYHGTNAEFTVFDFLRSGTNVGKAEGYGFNFTDNPEVAKSYGESKEYYLDIRKPLQGKSKTMTRAQFTKVVTALVDHDVAANARGGLTWQDSFLSNYVYTYDMSKAAAIREVVNIMYDANDTDVDLVYELANADGRNYRPEDIQPLYDVLKKSTGYDGIHTTWSDNKTGESSEIYLAFYPNQIKLTSNKKPSYDPDIRYDKKVPSEDVKTEEQKNAERREKVIKNLVKTSPAAQARAEKKAADQATKIDYDTTETHWALQEGAINKKDLAIFYKAIADISKRGYYSHRTYNGEYIIESDNKLIFTNGNFEKPNISRVIEFNDSHEDSMAWAKGWIYDEAQRGMAGWLDASIEVINSVYGEGYTKRFDHASSRVDEKQIRVGEGTDRRADFERAEGDEVKYDKKKYDEIEDIVVPDSFEIEAQESDKIAPLSRDSNKNVRQFVSNTLKNSEVFGGVFQDVYDELMEERPDAVKYDPKGELESMFRANQRIQSDAEGEIENLLADNEALSGEDIDTAMGLIAMLQNSGDTNRAMDLAVRIAQEGTRLGQGLQAFAKWSRTATNAAINTIGKMSDGTVSEDKAKRISERALEIAKQTDNKDGKTPKQYRKQLTDNIISLARIRNTTSYFTSDVMKGVQKALNKLDDAELKAIICAQIRALGYDQTSHLSAAKVASTALVLNDLTNLVTGSKNIAGNTVFDTVDALSTNVAVMFDKLMSLRTGHRTIGADTWWFSSAKRKGAVRAAIKSYVEVALDVDMEATENRYGQTSNRTFKMSGNAMERFMSRWEKHLSYMLTTTDEFAKGGVRSQYLDATNKFVESGKLTKEAQKELAEITAKERTFQQDSKLASLTVGIKNALNFIGFKGNFRQIRKIKMDNGQVFKIDMSKLNSGDYVDAVISKTKGSYNKNQVAQMLKNLAENGQGNFGLGNLWMNYPKIPANLADTAIQYSAGIAPGIYSMIQTLLAGDAASYERQRKAAMYIGRNFTGAGLIVAFYGLAKLGILSVLGAGGSDDEDEDRMNQKRAEGVNGMQINVSALWRYITGGDTNYQFGDELIGVDFLQPFDSLMTISAMLAESEDDPTFGDYARAYSGGVFQSVLNSPGLETFKNLYENMSYSSQKYEGNKLVDAILSSLLDSASRIIPAPLRQIAKATDPYYRELYSSDNILDQTWDRFKSNIPFARQTLPIKTDAFGNEKKYIDNPVWRYANALFLPFDVTTYSATDVSDEIERLYQSTGDASAYPSTNTPSEISWKDGEEEITVELTKKQRIKFREIRGKKYEEMAEVLMESDYYNNLSDEDRVKALNEIYDLATEYAKVEVNVGYEVKKGNDNYKMYKLTSQYGITSADAYELKIFKKQLSDDKSLTSDQRRLSLAEMINGADNWSDEQKQAAYAYAFEPSTPEIGNAKYTDEQKLEYENIYGKYVNDVYSSVMSSTKFASADEATKADMLYQANELAKFYAKKEWATNNRLSSESYDPKTEKNDYDQLMKSGVSFFDTYKIHQKIKEITDGDGKKTIMETDFRTWISQNTSLNENQKKLAVELFGELWTMSPVNSEKYDVLVSKYNFSNETANEIFKNISSIVPEEGKDSASQKQKDQAIVSMNLTNSQKYSALMAYANSDSSRDAIAKAQKKGISADQYVRGKYEIAKITGEDKNKDGKTDKDSRKRNIAKYLRTANLSYEAKCYFWQLEYSSETASSWRSFY